MSLFTWTQKGVPKWYPVHLPDLHTGWHWLSPAPWKAARFCHRRLQWLQSTSRWLFEPSFNSSFSPSTLTDYISTPSNHSSQSQLMPFFDWVYSSVVVFFCHTLIQLTVSCKWICMSHYWLWSNNYYFYSQTQRNIIFHQVWEYYDESVRRETS